MSADDPHRRLGRIDVRVADHELLEDVVLDRPRKLVLRARPAPPPRRCSRRAPAARAPFIVIDTETLVERDAVEQDLHVLDGVDGHPRLADVADHARVVGVVAAVGGEVEGDRDALPAAGERPPVERVRLLARWRSPRTGGWSTAAPRTSSACGPRTNGAKPGSVSAYGRPATSAAVYSGLTSMPSGVCQVSGIDVAAGRALRRRPLPVGERGGRRLRGSWSRARRTSSSAPRLRTVSPLF